ncbi:hypothetical protein FisN_13Lh385 [Fistulifera solaris]|uniref:Uncharacterized protein n=1 Tax=Fistulifera solaris TaxID=1519565 RepID=A0A1Z5JAK1_FISSO|nr:hypothetical protein FisN_13Lh385 [Fistulifera solaris]|eukprot:GAX10781.1 hypothetical protein FisN_13Lh385 [Fistulifera solaris]
MLIMITALLLLVIHSLSLARSVLPETFWDDITLSSLDKIQSLPAATIAQTNDGFDCSKMFLYIPQGFEGSGITSKLQNFILASHVAASFHREIVVIDPGLNASSESLGCSSEGNTIQYVDLLNLLEIPSAMACKEALCTKTYSEWKQILATAKSNDELTTVTCYKKDNGPPTSVMVSGGFALRDLYPTPIRDNAKQLDFPLWVRHLGATPRQLEFFRNTSNTVEDLWTGVAGLIAPKVQWRASIRKQVTKRITEMHLPPRFTAIHVRRGDKLNGEAYEMVKAYWEFRGGNPNKIKYLPLEAYVAQLDIFRDPLDIYIATDDPVTVGKEIKQLKAGTKWKIHILSGHRSHPGHVLQENNCTVRYAMTMDALAELEVLIRADVFVGEFNSNWGKYIHTMRTDFTEDYPKVRDFRFAITLEKENQYLGH